LITRQSSNRGAASGLEILSMKAALSIGANSPGPLQIGGHNRGDLRTQFIVRNEIGNGDRQRLDIGAIDVDFHHGARRPGREQHQCCNHGQGNAKNVIDHFHNAAFQRLEHLAGIEVDDHFRP
jgi:hypothetical protein